MEDPLLGKEKVQDGFTFALVHCRRSLRYLGTHNLDFNPHGHPGQRVNRNDQKARMELAAFRKRTSILL